MPDTLIALVGKDVGSEIHEISTPITEADPLYWLEALDQEDDPPLDWHPIENAFCPTGEGGGVDPTCSPGSQFLDVLGSKLPDPSKVKIIKTLPGSTGPKLVEDENGKQWVMKTASGPNGADKLRNEAEADAVYRVLGIAVPKSGVVVGPNGPVKFSEHLEGKTLGQWEQGKPPEAIAAMHTAIGTHMAADALLANWDVIGLNRDNILVHEGKPYRVDNGGALKYRAQGSPKGLKFGEAVGELNTLRNSGINPSAGQIFKHLSDKEVIDQVKDLADKHDKILNVIDDPVTKKIVGERLAHLKVIASSGVLFTIPVSFTPPPSGTPGESGWKPVQTPLTQPPSTEPPSAKPGLYTGKSLVDYLKANKGKVPLTPLYLNKLEYLNPNGILHGEMKIPTFPKGEKSSLDKVELFKKVLPEGTTIKTVSVTAQKLAKKIEAGKIKLESAIAPKIAKHFGGYTVTPAAPGVSSTPSSIATPAGAVSLSQGKGLTPEQQTWGSKLDFWEYSAINSWKGSARSIRKAIASGDPAHPSAASAKYFLSGISKAPSYEGKVYRGFSGKYATEQIKAFDAAGVGGTWSDVSPMCMSRTPKTGTEFAGESGVLLAIKSKTGKPIEHIGGFLSEKEVVGMPGVVYKIKHITHNPKIHIGGHYAGSVKMLVSMEEV